MILTGKTVIDIQTTTTTTGNVCCGFSFLTEPPSVDGNLTSDQPRVQFAVSQRLEKVGILDMARGNVHFQQYAWGYFPFKRLLRCRDDRLNGCL